MADDTGKPKTESVLPSVEAPSISPADTADTAPVESTEPVAPTAEAAETAKLPRRTAWAALAASVLLAGVLGGVFGALATGVRPKDVAADHERLAMQQSLTRLTKEVATLKSQLAAADKTSKAQTARVAELDRSLRERLTRDEGIVTGSIALPATAPAAVSAPTPLPPPRPAVLQASSSDGVAGWTVLGMRRGFVYVQSGHDIYRVVPGARLPGLGPVEDIRRESGGWVVVTQRGTIVASRDRY